MKVLVFGAVWCPECIIMKPILEEIQSEIKNIKIEYYDCDEHKELEKKMECKKVPTYIFLNKNNEEVERKTGILSKKKFLSYIEKYNNN